MAPKTTTAPTPVETKFDFLAKVLITAIVRNKAGIEEKKVQETVFQLDAKSAEKPWFVLKNFLVPKFLNKTIGPEGAGWVKIYEIKILKLVNRANPNEVDGIPLRVMTMEQLEQYCHKWEYPVKPKLYHSVEVARQMVALFEEDPKGFEHQQKKYLEGGMRKYPEMDDVRRNTDKYLGDSEALASEFDNLDQKPAEPKGPATDEPHQKAEDPAGNDAMPAEVRHPTAADRKAEQKAAKLKAKREAKQAEQKAPTAPSNDAQPAETSDPFSAV